MDVAHVSEPVSAITEPIAVTEPTSAITCFVDIDIEPLSGVPFFQMIMCKYHMTATTVKFPTNFWGNLPKKAAIPMILTHGTGSWKMRYSGNRAVKRFGDGWKTFVKDNMLKIGDVCLFELMSCELSLIIFKVQVLRGDLPPALLEKDSSTQDSLPETVSD